MCVAASIVSSRTTTDVHRKASWDSTFCFSCCIRKRKFCRCNYALLNKPNYSDFRRRPTEIGRGRSSVIGTSSQQDRRHHRSCWRHVRECMGLLSVSPSTTVRRVVQKVNSQAGNITLDIKYKLAPYLPAAKLADKWGELVSGASWHWGELVTGPKWQWGELTVNRSIISAGCCRSPARTSFTPTSGILYHHLQPETSCSQFDITRQTLCSWQL